VSFIDKDTVTTFNLGDSRLYHYSFLENDWTQITRDHNLYNYFLDLSEKDPKIDINELCTRHRSQLLSLTKCLESGSNAHRDYDKFIFHIALGDVLFQATDGVYHYLKLTDVNNVIKTNNNNFNAISGNLIDIALENRSNDNLTCVIMECANADSKAD
jgi:serine/threonine protein phosphatase PrpC